MARETIVTCDVCRKTLAYSYLRTFLGDTYDLCDDCYRCLQQIDIQHEKKIGEFLGVNKKEGDNG